MAVTECTEERIASVFFNPLSTVLKTSDRISVLCNGYRGCSRVRGSWL
jgi:hypothetical protein